MAAPSLISPLDLCGGLQGVSGASVSPVHLLFSRVLSFLLFTPLQGPGNWSGWGLQMLAPAEELCLSRWSQALTLDRLPAASSEWNANPSGLLPERHAWY